MPSFSPAHQCTAKLRAYESLRYGAFVHFNMQPFFSTPDEFCLENDPAHWNPSQLDVEQWFRCFWEAGFRYAVLTAKHTSDFCLWPTHTTASHVMNSPVKVDIVGEFVRFARMYQIRPCLYYCLWGGTYNHRPDARSILLAQLRELLENYGDLFLLWLDMGCWRPENLSIQEIYDFVKSIQPDILVHFNQHLQDGSELVYFPTDLVNGEERLPPETGHQKERLVNGKRYYLPMESEFCLQQTDAPVENGYMTGTRWFTYGEGLPGVTPSHPLDPDTLLPLIETAYDRGASTLLLSTAPGHTGRMRACDTGTLKVLRDRLCRDGYLPAQKAES